MKIEHKIGLTILVVLMAAAVEQQRRQSARLEAEAEYRRVESLRVKVGGPARKAEPLECVSLPRSALRIEVAPLTRDSAELEFQGLHGLVGDSLQVEPSLMVSGLRLNIVERRKGPHRRCVDQDQHMLLEQRRVLWLRDSLIDRVDGAVVIMTTDGTAASMLLSLDLPGEIDMRGGVVAFVGSEDLIALAPRENVKAIRAAARAVTMGVNPSRESGCVETRPLIFSEGNWFPWESRATVEPEVAAFMQLAEACLAANKQRSMEGLMAEGAVLSTPRAFDSEVGSVATLAMAPSQLQLMAKADQLEVVHADQHRTRISWNEFLRLAPGALRPITVDGWTYSDVWLFDPLQAQGLEARTVAATDTAHRPE